MVAAASCLDEDVERCNALSAGGRALADAGRSLAMFEDAAFVDLEWSCATEPLAATSISLQSAAQALTGLDDTLGAAFSAAAAELEDASSISGCISLAAAAGPNLQSAGAALLDAGEAIVQQGQRSAPCTSARRNVGALLGEAGIAVTEAGRGLAESGRSLEEGGLQAP